MFLALASRVLDFMSRLTFPALKPSNSRHGAEPRIGLRLRSDMAIIRCVQRADDTVEIVERMQFGNPGRADQFNIETERAPEIGLAFLNAGPRRMKAAFSLLLASMVDAGELAIEDPSLAAEQFVSMCKGLGDLERRFGATTDPERNAQRIAGAVEVFLTAYGAMRAEP